MGQSHSHLQKPIGLWHRRKSKATTREPSQESFVQMPPPSAERGLSSQKMDQASDNPEPSPTTAKTTPDFVPPGPDMHDDAMQEATNGIGKAGNVDRTKERATSPHDQPMPDRPDHDQPTLAAVQPTSSRPAPKRQHTPPHRIKILTAKAWQVEHVYGNVHDHLTLVLNRVKSPSSLLLPSWLVQLGMKIFTDNRDTIQIRQQQTESNRPSATARRMEADVYKAADSVTLALEYLVGHFSTKFFHHTGPERIISMMAEIDADATALDDLRLKQYHMVNYSYNLERKLAGTEKHIRELAELAKRIRDGDAGGAENGDADAEGETDPEVDMKNGDAGGVSY